MDNRVLLSGVVSKTPFREVSPSGIPHCWFYIEHCSQQIEAGFERRVQCALPVVISGQDELSDGLKKGSKVCIDGFINMRYRKNNLSQIVLHAAHVKLLGE